MTGSIRRLWQRDPMASFSRGNFLRERGVNMGEDTNGLPQDGRGEDDD